MRSMVEGASKLRTRSAERRTKEKNNSAIDRQRIDFVAARAPSTALRAVPLPRYRGGG